MKKSLSIAVMMLLGNTSANLTLKQHAPTATSAFAQHEAKADAAVLAQADAEASEIEAANTFGDDKEEGKKGKGKKESKA